MLAKSFVIISEYTAAAKVLKEMVGKYPDEFGMDLAIVELLEMMSKNAIAKEKLENIRERLDEAPKVVRQGVFSELHGYHYLGVCLFYLANYEEAHEEFSKAYKERELMNIENELDSRDLRNALNSEESQDEDPSVDRELHEINYNQFLCQLALGEYKKAYEQFIRDIVPAK
jgi:tetratricopeptide (TPR) repeat protein